MIIFSIIYIFQITFLQIDLKTSSMTCSITFVLAGVSLLYLCVYFLCVFIFFNFSFLFYFTCVYVFGCLEHDFYNNNNNNNISVILRIGLVLTDDQLLLRR